MITHIFAGFVGYFVITYICNMIFIFYLIKILIKETKTVSEAGDECRDDS